MESHAPAYPMLVKRLTKLAELPGMSANAVETIILARDLIHKLARARSEARILPEELRCWRRDDAAIKDHAVRCATGSLLHFIENEVRISTRTDAKTGALLTTADIVVLRQGG